MEDLVRRIRQNVSGQEGDLPYEDPNRLLQKLHETSDRLSSLIAAINRTNQAAGFDENGNLADAIIHRDELVRLSGALREILDSAGGTVRRYSLTEIKNVVYLDITRLNDEADDLARRARIIDAKIQQINWATDLIE